MNLTLKRTDATISGIFGELHDEHGGLFAVTLEHAYEVALKLVPKLPSGVYVCKRGQHQLHSGPIETFEVTGVPGHSGILIHPGNTEAASEGCILVGDSRVDMMITGSRDAFNRFMKLQENINCFSLTVED